MKRSIAIVVAVVVGSGCGATLRGAAIDDAALGEVAARDLACDEHHLALLSDHGRATVGGCGKRASYAWNWSEHRWERIVDFRAQGRRQVVAVTASGLGAGWLGFAAMTDGLSCAETAWTAADEVCGRHDRAPSTVAVNHARTDLRDPYHENPGMLNTTPDGEKTPPSRPSPAPHK